MNGVKIGLNCLKFCVRILSIICRFDVLWLVFGFRRGYFDGKKAKERFKRLIIIVRDMNNKKLIKKELIICQGYAKTVSCP